MDTSPDVDSSSSAPAASADVAASWAPSPLTARHRFVSRSQKYLLEDRHKNRNDCEAWEHYHTSMVL